MLPGVNTLFASELRCDAPLRPGQTSVLAPFPRLGFCTWPPWITIMLVVYEFTRRETSNDYCKEQQYSLLRAYSFTGMLRYSGISPLSQFNPNIWMPAFKTPAPCTASWIFAWNVEFEIPPLQNATGNEYHTFSLPPPLLMRPVIVHNDCTVI